MLIRILTILALVPFGCAEKHPTEPEPGSSRWVLDDSTAYIAILQVDFATYQFEGGVLTSYPLCDSCDLSKIPFSVSSQPPADFGWNLFQYAVTGDTVFYGESVWSGRGDRIIPRELLDADSFLRVNKQIMDPWTKEFFPSLPFQDDDWVRMKADSAWTAVKGLDITHAFSLRSYRIGLYFYPRRVGAFIPEDADWIVFLYAGNRR